MDRLLKQFLFALLFLAIFGGISFWIYRITRPVVSCFDKIQNQGEEAVDCGGVCGNFCLSSLKPIEIKNSYLFKITEESGGVADYDTLFKVYNPNSQFGSSRVDYEVLVLDAENNVLKINMLFSFRL